MMYDVTHSGQATRASLRLQPLSGLVNEGGSPKGHSTSGAPWVSQGLCQSYRSSNSPSAPSYLHHCLAGPSPPVNPLPSVPPLRVPGTCLEVGAHPPCSPWLTASPPLGLLLKIIFPPHPCKYYTKFPLPFLILLTLFNFFFFFFLAFYDHT